MKPCATAAADAGPAGCSLAAPLQPQQQRQQSADTSAAAAGGKRLFQQAVCQHGVAAWNCMFICWCNCAWFEQIFEASCAAQASSWT
jgi:hypothetical protein